MNYDGLNIGLLPWIAEDNEEESLEFINNCNASILGAHLELQGFDMSKGMPCMDGMSRQPFEKFEMVLTGHFHAKSTQGNIHYLGAQMEFFWNDCDDPKYFHILDTKTRELTPIQNPYRIYEKIYYDHEKINDFQDLRHLDEKFVKIIVVNKGDPYKFERFVDRVQSQKIHELKIAEDFSEFIGTNVSDEEINLDNTETIVYNYIDSVVTDLDKERIKKEISTLMVEAENIEIE